MTARKSSVETAGTRGGVPFPEEVDRVWRKMLAQKQLSVSDFDTVAQWAGRHMPKSRRTIVALTLANNVYMKKRPVI